MGFRTSTHEEITKRVNEYVSSEFIIEYLDIDTFVVIVEGIRYYVRFGVDNLTFDFIDECLSSARLVNLELENFTINFNVSAKSFDDLHFKVKHYIKLKVLL